MEKEQKIIGLCLKAQDYKDNDKIIFLMTPNGRINAIGRGIKKKNAKLKPVCQPFCLAEYLLIQQGEMSLIANATVINTNYHLLSDYDLFEFASIGLKVAYSLCYQIQDNKLLYDLLLQYLQEFSKTSNILEYQHALCKFLINILIIAGYALDTKQCSVCGNELSKGAFFNQLDGHFYCQNCYKDTKNLISKQCLDYISYPELYKNDKSVIDEALILLKKCIKIYFNYSL